MKPFKKTTKKNSNSKLVRFSSSHQSSSSLLTRSATNNLTYKTLGLSGNFNGVITSPTRGGATGDVSIKVSGNTVFNSAGSGSSFGSKPKLSGKNSRSNTHTGLNSQSHKKSSKKSNSHSKKEEKNLSELRPVPHKVTQTHFNHKIASHITYPCTPILYHNLPQVLQDRLEVIQNLDKISYNAELDADEKKKKKKSTTSVEAI